MSTTFLPRLEGHVSPRNHGDRADKVRKPQRRLRLESIFSAMTLIHLAVLGALFTGARPVDWIVCGALYVIRMFGVTAGYHRYFSHRSFKMGRVGQFMLAFLAQTSAQKGVLWWASHHRHHHKHSDTDNDAHSAAKQGFFYSHVGWLYDENDETDWTKIKDFARYPELVWLNRFWWVPPLALGIGVFAALGWSGLFVGFFLSTVLLWHGTFLINSLSHVWGYQDYPSGDHSRNNFVLALITLGEGWHNNHHYYQASARQGFRWWQIDITYYGLIAMSWVGLVRDIREPPADIVEGRHMPSHARRKADPAPEQHSPDDALLDAA